MERCASEWKNNPVPVNDNVLRHEIPWNILRTHIIQSFLGGEEQVRLRADVAKQQQKPYETVPAYIVRFCEETQIAYPQYLVTEVES